MERIASKLTGHSKDGTVGGKQVCHDHHSDGTQRSSSHRSWWHWTRLLYVDVLNTFFVVSRNVYHETSRCEQTRTVTKFIKFRKDNFPHSRSRDKSVGSETQDKTAANAFINPRDSTVTVVDKTTSSANR